MAGPIRVGDEVLWHDGSTGKKLVMAASVDTREANRVFNDIERGDWIGRQPPRAISTPSGPSAVLLIPGQPASRLITRHDNCWQSILDDLPSWATSGAYENGRLYLIGAVSGEFRFDSINIRDDLQSIF